MNTCKISTLKVNFLAASFPRIPGYIVLFLFFGFAMSSTMTASFLYHVLRDRECIQSQCVKLSSGFAVNQALSAIQFLDLNKEDSENIVLLVWFRTTRITPHYPIRGSSASNFC